MPDGSVQIVGFDEEGNPVQTGQAPFKPAEVRDFGGYVGGIDPITGKVAKYGDKTMTASERDASARGWAGVNLSRERLAMDKSGAGGSAPDAAKPGKPMTEAQAKASAFKSQMESAERELGSVPLDMSKLGTQVDVKLASSPLNIVASPAAQRARQAQEQWAEAYLRFKTGAAATEDEVRRNVKTFFPQQGDGKDVIEQKKRMRQQASSDVGFAATGTQGTTPPAVNSPPGSGAPVKVTTDADYNALPPGTRFVTPDGKTGTKR
jgi:hypothetical protein